MSVWSAETSSCRWSGACASRFRCLWTVQRWVGTSGHSAASAFSRPPAPSMIRNSGIFSPRATRSSSSARQAASLSPPMFFTASSTFWPSRRTPRTTRSESDEGAGDPSRAMTVPVTGERRDIGRLGGRRAVGRACFAIAAPMSALVPPPSQRDGQFLLDQLFDEAPDPIPDPRHIRPCPTPADTAAFRGVEVATLVPYGPPPITRITLPTCRAHCPGGSGRVLLSVASPSHSGLPRYAGGSASATSLSRPAQASRVLRPAGSLNRPKRPSSRGFNPPGYPARRSSATRSYRQLPGWLPSSTGDTRRWGALHNPG